MSLSSCWKKWQNWKTGLPPALRKNSSSARLWEFSTLLGPKSLCHRTIEGYTASIEPVSQCVMYVSSFGEVGGLICGRLSILNPQGNSILVQYFCDCSKDESKPYRSHQRHYGWFLLHHSNSEGRLRKNNKMIFEYFISSSILLYKKMYKETQTMK